MCEAVGGTGAEEVNEDDADEAGDGDEEQVISLTVWRMSFWSLAKSSSLSSSKTRTCRRRRQQEQRLGLWRARGRVVSSSLESVCSLPEFITATDGRSLSAQLLSRCPQHTPVHPLSRRPQHTPALLLSRRPQRYICRHCR